VFGMMTGRPECYIAEWWQAYLSGNPTPNILRVPPVVEATVLGILVVLALTYHLSSAFPGRWFRWFVVLGVGAAWVAVLGVLVYMFVGSLMSKGIVMALLLGATLWVPWLAWMFCFPLPQQTRFGVLVMLAAVSAVFPWALRVEGLTGEARLNFAWRWAPTRDAQVEQPASLPAEAVAIELKPGEHDYPQYLGPQRSGVLPNARLARDWNGTPPRELWRKPVGAGWGAFAVVGDYAITQEQRGPQECVMCYRIADGAILWLHADELRFDSSMGGPGPRATPTVVDRKVYAVGGTGQLNCLDGSNGRKLWSVNILEDNDAANLAHGVCGSPLVLDNLVLVCPTGKNGKSLVAYDRATGKRVWQGGEHQASYGSPMLAVIENQRQILLYNSAGIAAHDPADGKVLWSFPWTNLENTNCSQPIPNAGQSGRVFVSTGYNKGSALFAVVRSTDGVWSALPVWESRALKTKFTTPVLRGGYVYGLDDGILACIDLETGKRMWREGRYQHGQVLLAGDLLVVQAENGDVVLVEAVPDGHHEVGRIKALQGKTWNNPVLAGRFLLVRNDQEAACYELPAPKD
jgi:outer membrane protein assembly factor BamB